LSRLLEYRLSCNGTAHGTRVGHKISYWAKFSHPTVTINVEAVVQVAARDTRVGYEIFYWVQSSS